MVPHKEILSFTNSKNWCLFKNVCFLFYEMSEKLCFSEHTPKSKILDDSKNFHDLKIPEDF